MEEEAFSARLLNTFLDEILARYGLEMTWDIKKGIMGKGECLTSGCSVAELTSDYSPSTLISLILFFITYRSYRHMYIAVHTLFSPTRGRRVHLLLLPRSRAQALCRRLPHRKAG